MAAPRIFAAIPTRLASARLPNKPLADLGGRSLVLRVADAVRSSGRFEPVVVTDAPELAAHVEAAGFEVLLDARVARTGSDRLAAALSRLGDPPLADDDVVLNVQGDQPDLDPSALAALADHMRASPGCQVATLSAPLVGAADDPARVKVVADGAGRALYFSRAAVPHGGPFQVHLGVYAYRVAALRRMASLPSSALESIERLEQLRLVENGVQIDVIRWPRAWASIDTPADLEDWRKRHARSG